MDPHDAGTPPHIDDRLERLTWMRAEFREAQQRRYEKRAIAVANRALTGKPPAPEPPTLATPSR